ncbi:hypothetical protein PM082_014302 [Marasmius tenuissimus]|nr:hypothetical protein PM082_014302 [Marasmius tenuissimus]
MNLNVPYIICIVILSLDFLTLAFLLFPLPRTIWRYIHRFASDERKSIRTIRRGLKTLLIISTLFVLFLCSESLVRIIHYSIRDDRYRWPTWTYYYGRKIDARDNFFLAGATLLVSLALHRVLHIVISHLHLQEHLIEVYGKDIQSRPENLSSEWLYRRRTMQDVRDTFSKAGDAFYKVRLSLGFTGRIQLPATPDAESGSGNHFRDEVITRQENEIAELRRALSQVPSPTGSDNTVRQGPGSPGPGATRAQAVSSGAEALISSQEREIAELKNVIKNFSETLRAQTASQAASVGEKFVLQNNKVKYENVRSPG